MFRRLLACLALLTGLAAVGTPAHAGVAAVFGIQLELAEKSDSSGRQADSDCAERARQQQVRGERAAPCRPSKTVTIVIPTVQLGIDRAYE